MQRRSLIRSVLALAVAPAIVRADSLMRVYSPRPVVSVMLLDQFGNEPLNQIVHLYDLEDLTKGSIQFPPFQHAATILSCAIRDRRTGEVRVYPLNGGERVVASTDSINLTPNGEFKWLTKQF